MESKRKGMTKQEFMSRVTNDLYERKRLAKRNEADIHNIENSIKVREGRRRRLGNKKNS